MLLKFFLQKCSSEKIDLLVFLLAFSLFYELINLAAVKLGENVALKH